MRHAGSNVTLVFVYAVPILV